MKNDIIAEYVKEVSGAINCPTAVKKEFMRELKNDVEAFIGDKADVDTQALYERFGTPEEIADGFLERDDYESLLKKAKKRTAAAAAAAVVLAALCALALYFAITVCKDLGGTSHIEIGNGIVTEWTEQ